MKAQILKIAGVKNIQEFYKKFPTEEAFMKKHGEEFKLKCGGKLKKAEGGFDFTPEAEQPLQLEPWMTDTSWISGPVDNGEFNWSDIGGSAPNLDKKGVNWDNAFTKGIPIGGKLIQGIQQLKQEKENLRKATQWNEVSKLVLNASNTKPEEITRQYVRPEDNITTGEQLYPIYGTGTNVLAKSGIHIKPSKRGTFTAAATKHGKGVQEFASQVLNNKENYSPAMIKKANFARNTSKWNKGEDGVELIQPIVPDFTQAPQDLIPVDSNRMYSREYKFRDNGPTYYDEAIRLDKELQDAEGKLKRARINGSKAKWEGKIREAKQAKYDLLSHQYENFRNGGELEQANFGQILSAFDQAGGTDKVSGLITNFTGENAGGSLGGTIGETIGSFAGPVGSVVGQIGGQLIGTLLDKNPQRIKKQQNAMNRNIGAAAIND
ncbi:MAG: hypothetical protein H5T96_09765 [Tissierellales bacterium]|nr:hypothetical protein [Tissierellales bacterium]